MHITFHYDIIYDVIRQLCLLKSISCFICKYFPPGVNFINILRQAFMREDPKFVKKRQSRHQCLFTLLGPMCVKAARKMLMKLTTGQSFFNV
jgi:hypothetical protein